MLTAYRRDAWGAFTPNALAYLCLKKVAEQKMNRGEMPDVVCQRLDCQSIGASMRGCPHNFYLREPCQRPPPNAHCRP